MSPIGASETNRYLVASLITRIDRVGAYSAIVPPPRTVVSEHIGSNARQVLPGFCSTVFQLELEMLERKTGWGDIK